MESKSVDTRSLYRELGATLSYNMRLGNGMEVEPWLKAAVRKEFVDDNRVKGKRLVRTVLIFTESSDQLSRATDRVPGLPASPGYVQ